MNEYEIRQYLFTGLITLSFFIVLFACFGMVFKWIRNRCCIMLFGTLLLPLWALTVSVGLAAVFISYTAADEFEKECDALVAQRKTGAKEIIFDEEGDNLEINLNIFKDAKIDQWMCSLSCPCAEVREARDWIRISPLELALDYDRNLEFQFGALPGEDFVVETFEECIRRADENYYAAPIFAKFAKDWRESVGFSSERDYMTFFENEYDCSGICEKALFSFSKSISNGKPKSCFNSIKSEVRDSMWWLGVAAFGSGILLVVLWFCQYCLWKKY